MLGIALVFLHYFSVISKNREVEKVKVQLELQLNNLFSSTKPSA